MTAHLRNVAVVDRTRRLDASLVAGVAAALSKQAVRDLAPAWHVAANVVAVPAGAHTPLGYWEVRLEHGIGEPGALGVHMDDHLQPYALVDVTDPAWSQTASHELCEMLVDPWGNDLRAAHAPPGFPGPAGRVRYLVEVCDPCEATSYDIDGVAVSDFLLPGYYRTVQRPGSPAAFASDLPVRAIAPGGYVSLVDAGHEWWQGFADDRGHVEWQNQGPADAREGSLRAWTDRLARDRRLRPASPAERSTP